MKRRREHELQLSLEDREKKDKPFKRQVSKHNELTGALEACDVVELIPIDFEYVPGAFFVTCATLLSCKTVF